jgi:hypothetical protein
VAAARWAQNEHGTCLLRIGNITIGHVERSVSKRGVFTAWGPGGTFDATSMEAGKARLLNETWETLGDQFAAVDKLVKGQ